MIRPVFRFAPSPNGFLHLGHAYSALLNEDAARRANGRFLLRIEDIDTERCTPALTRQALQDLAWLGLAWEEPVLVQSDHFADYRTAQDELRAMGLLYPCFCSRQDILRAAGDGTRDPEGQPLYPGTCKKLLPDDVLARIAAGAPYAMRVDMARALACVTAPLFFFDHDARHEARPEVWGDVILSRKDIATSYHVAVIVDDARQGVTHVVRGRDLFAATPIHCLLQRLLNLPQPLYAHHDLIGDNHGRKLSKSLKSRALRDLRADGVTPGAIRAALGF